MSAVQKPPARRRPLQPASQVKNALKQVLGELPLTAELYWRLRQGGQPLSKSFSLRRTQQRLPGWLAEAGAPPAGLPLPLPLKPRRAARKPAGRAVLVFATLRYWIEHAVLLSTALAGLGARVTLAYLPYANWRSPIDRFDLRRQNAYTARLLQPAADWINPVSLVDLHSSAKLPLPLALAVQQVSERDVQYTLQVEAVDPASNLYYLRLERNEQAARLALAYLSAHRPEVVLTPNGSILEMGAVYQAARYLDIPVVTYEFGEQRNRIWLAQDAEVMRQDTGALWQARRAGSGLSAAEKETIQSLYSARRGASLWENFARRWQGQPSQGGEQARQALGLDARPVVLLAANVIGDSLTLGRQVFSHSMTEWLLRSVQMFAARPDVQLVVRIHPGERYTQGPSVAEVIQSAAPGGLPEHIHVVPAADPLNTYDLIEIADLGLVYTTTVGMEMAMSGVPVIVAGQTHYRGKGFTLDPASWEDYAALLEQTLAAGDAAHRLTQEQVELAWEYAYRFFFEYPLPFPWHLLHFWNELETWSVKRVLSNEGQAEYGAAFQALMGEPIRYG
jgi:hypothetical protein